MRRVARQVGYCRMCQCLVPRNDAVSDIRRRTAQLFTARFSSTKKGSHCELRSAASQSHAPGRGLGSISAWDNDTEYCTSTYALMLLQRRRESFDSKQADYNYPSTICTCQGNFTPTSVQISSTTRCANQKVAGTTSHPAFTNTLRRQPSSPLLSRLTFAALQSHKNLLATTQKNAQRQRMSDPRRPAASTRAVPNKQGTVGLKPDVHSQSCTSTSPASPLPNNTTLLEQPSPAQPSKYNLEAPRLSFL